MRRRETARKRRGGLWKTVKQGLTWIGKKLGSYGKYENGEFKPLKETASPHLFNYRMFHHNRTRYASWRANSTNYSLINERDALVKYLKANVEDIEDAVVDSQPLIDVIENAVYGSYDQIDNAVSLLRSFADKSGFVYPPRKALLDWAREYVSKNDATVLRPHLQHIIKTPATKFYYYALMQQDMKKSLR